MLQPLAHRDFALLWTAMTVSMLGDGLYFVALAWASYDRWGGASTLAVLGAAWTAPMALLLLPAGVMSDRFDRRTLLIASDLARAFAMAGLVTLVVVGAETWQLALVVAVYGAGDAFFWPAFISLVPQIVPREQLVQANSLDQLVRQSTLQLLGPAVGGMVIAAFGVVPAFLFDTGSFLFSALVLMLIRPRPAREWGAGSAGSALREALQGVRWVRSQRWLVMAFIWTPCFLLVFWGPYEVLMPGLVKDELGGSAKDLGFVLGAGGLGAVIGALVVAQRGYPRRLISFQFACWTAGLALVAMLALTGTTWQAMLATMGVGGAFAVAQVGWATMFQRLVPGELLGRVSSIDGFLSVIMAPLSFLLAAPAASSLGVRGTLAAAGLVGAALTLTVLLLPGLRDPERDGSLEHGAVAAVTEIVPAPGSH